jgi:hypothetical protein
VPNNFAPVGSFAGKRPLMGAKWTRRQRPQLIDHLDQAILSTAFQGELVPQDPSDEPASMLLDPIRSA